MKKALNLITTADEYKFNSTNEFNGMCMRCVHSKMLRGNRGYMHTFAFFLRHFYSFDLDKKGKVRITTSPKRKKYQNQNEKKKNHRRKMGIKMKNDTNRIDVTLFNR